MTDLIYPELSYRLVGLAYEVFNELGIGYQEKYYQRAYVELLKREKINLTEQLMVDLKINNIKVGKYFIDLLINDLIVVELKVIGHLRKRDIEQVLGYLKATNKRLGIIFMFTQGGVEFRRIINTYNANLH